MIDKENGLQKNVFEENYYYEDFYLDYIEFMSIYYKDAFDDPDECVFIDSGVPSELIMAMGLKPVMIELIPTLLVDVKVSEKIMNLADRYFSNNGTCSFSRFALPAFDKGNIPLPSAFISTTACKDMSNNISMIAERFDIPIYHIDIPYKNNEDAVEYLTNQYKGIQEFLINYVDAEPDEERIKDVMNNSMEFISYMNKTAELRKNKPALLYGGQMLKFKNINFMRGCKEVANIAKKFYEMLKFRKENMITPVKNEEVRILWDGSSPLYTRDFFRVLEKDMGAVIVAEPLCISPYLDDFLKDEDPLKSLARLTLNNQLGRVDGDLIAEKVKEYDIDGVIHCGQLNCNVINDRTWLLKNKLEECEIPFLELSCDHVDKRNSGIEQINTRLEAFLEMIN